MGQGGFKEGSRMGQGGFKEGSKVVYTPRLRYLNWWIKLNEFMDNPALNGFRGGLYKK